MILYDKEEKKLTFTESAIAGGASGSITRLILQPLDVIKTRFQLQVEPISSRYEKSKYQGMIQAYRTILKEERIWAFWKGHSSAQMLSVLYGISQFAAYEELSNVFIFVNSDQKHESWVNFLNGGIASGIATVVSFPFDVTRTRFIAQGNKIYETTFGAFVCISKNEGFIALYKGLLPTLVQSLPYGACQFGFYTVFNKMYSYTFSRLGIADSKKNTAGGMLSSGFLAGMCAKAVIYPFDICRKRLQIQGFQIARKNYGKEFVCSGMVDCFLKIYKYESWQGLFKGLQPAMIKSAFVTSIYFTLYDVITSHLGNSDKV